MECGNSRSTSVSSSLCTMPENEGKRCFMRSLSYWSNKTLESNMSLFEMLVWPYIDRSKLQKCVILCDQLGFQRVIDESIALHEVGHSYMIVTVPAACRFHPKVWFMLNETEVDMQLEIGRAHV